MFTGVLPPEPDDAETVFYATSGQQDPPAQSTASPADTTGLPISAGGIRVAASRAVLGPLTVGEQFGSRYHILKQLGVGGMGAVYQAWDAELEVAVALKVIRPEVTRDAAAAQDIERRFKQELLLARQVTHKNVVRIHDLGEINGIKYITMPYIEGSDLATVLRDKKLTIPRVLAIAREIAAGLQAAHEAGVVHRDLKPANVMIEHEHAIIMDFGIARSTSRAGSAPAPATVGALRPAVDAEMTRIAATVVGEVIGTIEYMAPEQARGEHVDQRADVYAFGLIVYDMLIGRRRSEHAVSAVGELQGRLAHAPPSVRSVVPGVPETLDALVAKCVEPEPEKRFQTTAELVAALDRLDDNGKLKPKKRAVALPLVSAVALGLLTLSGYIYWVTRPPVQHDPVSVVVADFANTTGDTGFDGTLESMMKVALEGASFMTVYDRAGIRRNLGVTPPEKLDERAAQELAVRQGVGVVLSGSIAPDGRGYRLSIKAVRAATGEVITDLDQRAQDKDRVLATAGDLATDIRQALGDDTSESAQRFAMVTWTANSLDVVHEYAIALQAVSNTDYEQATQSFTKAVTLDPNFGPGYVGLAVVALNMQRQDLALKHATEALRHVDRMTDREKLHARGLFYLVSNDYQACTKEFGDLIARFAQDTAAHTNLAYCSSRLRQLDRAVKETQQVVAMLPRRSLHRVNLSLYASYGGNFQLAQEAAQTAQEMKSRWAWFIVALAHMGNGQVAAATEAYKELAKVDALGISQSVSGLADIAMYEGRYGDAVRLLESGATADAASDSPEKSATKLATVADLHLLLGRKNTAVAVARRALMNSRAIKIRFMAARVFVAAGESKSAQEIAAELAKELPAEPRAYAKIIEGELQLMNGEVPQAIESFTAANQLLDTWIGHFDLGRAYLEAKAFPRAEAEFDACVKRRGEAISLFLDEEPTYGYFPAAYYYLGRAREGFGTLGFANSYQTYLSIRGNSKEDALVRDAQRGAAAK